MNQRTTDTLKEWRLGKRIAEALGLKPVGENKYKTEWGVKNPIALTKAPDSWIEEANNDERPWWPEIEIETTPLFWDCECAEDYIHPASQAVCEHCHAQREEQPDARVSELPA